MYSLKQNYKTLLILFIIGSCICSFFWLSSRYPALNLKAIMGSQTGLSGLGFDVLVAVQDHDNIIKRILLTTVNWLYSNIEGMSFGLLIAPVILSAFSLFSHTQAKNPISASLLGAFIGAPLGVCANCATPIAQGVKSAKGKTETMLALIVSSPTLNIMVLTMVFTMLPIYMAVIKVVFTLFIIIVAIPIIGRFFGTDTALIPKDIKNTQSAIKTPPKNQSWPSALVWVSKTLAHNFFFIIKIVLPLMLLSGLVGSIIITLLPLDYLAHLPVSGYLQKTLLLVFISVIGTLLPVPIAFDVIVSSALLQQALHPSYIAALLVTLGPFSIYPFLVVKNSCGIRAALAMLLVIIGTGIMAGLASNIIEPSTKAWQDAQLTEDISSQQFSLNRVEYQAPHSYESINPVKPDTEIIFIDRPDLKVSSKNYTTPKAISQERIKFNKQLGEQWGIDKSYRFSVESFTDESLFKGIASGDINQDGWQDILLTDADGLRVYINQKGISFKEVPIANNAFKNKQITVAALADIDNDHDLDIILGQAQDHLYYISNEQGRFSSAAIRLPNLDNTIMSSSLSFADINKNGFLDILVGNWSVGDNAGDIGLISSTNTLLLNKNKVFTTKKLSCKPGETLTSLLSDINNDNNIDALIGNDFLIPDCFYTGSKNGLQPNDRLINKRSTTIFTMSYSSADINNDGHLDIYSVDIADPAANSTQNLNQHNTICDSLKDTPHYSHCINKLLIQSNISHKPQLSHCKLLASPKFYDDCIAFMFYKKQYKGDISCENLPDDWTIFRQSCNNYQKAISHGFVPGEFIVPEQNGNALHIQQQDGSFKELAKTYKVNHAGWGWNAKFNDLDQDGWQDLFVVNGYWDQRYREGNQLFLNNKGIDFSNISQQTGMNSYEITTSYTYVDIDNDGDTDIITNPAFGPVEVYQNQSAKQNSIQIELYDYRGNFYAIGAKVYLEYTDGIQMRELTLGGGYVSYDSPVIHFGLGKNTQIKHLTIVWPDGEKHQLLETLPANKRYVISRK